MVGIELAAAKRLGWDAIPSVELYGEKVDARTWQHHENLCRAELTVLERAEHIEEQRKLVRQKSEGGQAAPPGGHQPKDAEVKKTAKALGLTREEVRRSKVIAALSAKTKAEVRRLGLDDNQAALLEIAKQPATSAQLRAVAEIAARKHAGLVGHVSATPGATDKKTAEEIKALEATQLKTGYLSASMMLWRPAASASMKSMTNSRSTMHWPPARTVPRRNLNSWQTRQVTASPSCRTKTRINRRAAMPRVSSGG